jgi:hypothetical protein
VFVLLHTQLGDVRNQTSTSSTWQLKLLLLAPGSLYDFFDVAGVTCKTEHYCGLL